MQKLQRHFFIYQIFSIIEIFVLAIAYFSPEGVSSALESLTSVFGMRTGVTFPLNHQNKYFNGLYVDK